MINVITTYGKTQLQNMVTQYCPGENRFEDHHKSFLIKFILLDLHLKQEKCTDVTHFIFNDDAQDE